MPTRKFRLIFGLLAAFALVAAACGGAEDAADTVADAADEAADEASDAAGDAEDAVDDAMEDDAMEDDTEDAAAGGGDLPGAGVTVTMARGNWVETNFQNAVVQQLLVELGYEVNQPEEIAPATFFPAIAQGDFDLWASTWPLNHDPLAEGESPDGGIIADYIQNVGTMMESGALQGLLVDKASVEEFGFTTLNELLENPDAVAHFDSDGDGKADINGCDDGWGCQKVINDTISQNGWDDKVAQVSATHAALFVESQASFETGGPVLQYVWTPTAFVGKLVPGRDVVWLAIDADSALPGQDGVSEVGDACSASPCTTGFTPSDIVITANNEWLEANPAAKTLLDGFKMDPVAVAVQAVAIDSGANSEQDISDAAAKWIADNRDTLDPLIESAIAAA